MNTQEYFKLIFFIIERSSGFHALVGMSVNDDVSYSDYDHALRRGAELLAERVNSCSDEHSENYDYSFKVEKYFKLKKEN